MSILRQVLLIVNIKLDDEFIIWGLMVASHPVRVHVGVCSESELSSSE